MAKWYRKKTRFLTCNGFSGCSTCTFVRDSRDLQNAILFCVLLSLCLSRARLGKGVAFIYKWLKKPVLAHLCLPTSCADCRARSRQLAVRLSMERIDRCEKRHTFLSAAFPMFVPSLSW